MKTKTKNIVAIMMATIIAMALITPMAMAQSPSEAVLGNKAPYVCSQKETPKPAPPAMWGGTRTITVTACVCDPNGNDDILKVYACTPKGTIELDRHTATDPDCVLDNCLMELADGTVVTVDIDCVEYMGTFEMEPCDQPGNYKVVITAKDTTGAESNRLVSYFKYQGTFVPYINFDKIDYGLVEMLEKKYVEPGIFHNKGSVPLTVEIHATEMTGPGGLEDMNLDAEVGGVEKPLRACNYVPFDHVFKCCVVTPLTFSILPPIGIPAGTYTGTIEIISEEVVECTQRFELGPDGDLQTYDNGGWSTKVAVKNTGGWYGGIEEDGARMVCGAGNSDLQAWVKFDNCNDMRLQKIRIRHLDGIAPTTLNEDSFDVYVTDAQDIRYKLGHYDAVGGSEDWVITMFHVEDAIEQMPVTCCPVTVEIVFTETPWDGYGTWGQLAIDWVEMTCCETCP